MTDQTVSAVLYAAADHIEEFGLCQGSASADYSNPGKAAACTLGALALRGGHGWEVALHALAAYREDDFVAHWSDNTPAAEVVATLRACALIEAAKESADVRELVSA